MAVNFFFGGMDLKGEHKVNGGKLIRIRLQEKKGAVFKIRITGDFFLHPEESIFELEKALEGTKLEQCSILEKIQNVFQRLNIESIGVKPEDFVLAILKVKNSDSNPK